MSERTDAPDERAPASRTAPGFGGAAPANNTAVSARSERTDAPGERAPGRRSEPGKRSERLAAEQLEMALDEPLSPPVVVDSFTFQIEVVRSARRKRTVGASLRDGVLRVVIPSWMSRDDELHWIEQMMVRYRRKAHAGLVDLSERAEMLARRYDLPMPVAIRWVDNMTTQWGSCTKSTATIRLSNRLARFPRWVLDYVIVHELAHLVHADHSPEFWQLVHRYPKTERATGYLIAKAGDVESE